MLLCRLLFRPLKTGGPYPRLQDFLSQHGSKTSYVGEKCSELVYNLFLTYFKLVSLLSLTFLKKVKNWYFYNWDFQGLYFLIAGKPKMIQSVLEVGDWYFHSHRQYFDGFPPNPLKYFFCKNCQTSQKGFCKWPDSE